MAARAPGGPGEERLAAPGRTRIVAARGGRRRGQAVLIVPQRRQLGLHEVLALGFDVDPQPRLLEAAVASHLRHRDVVVPVRDVSVARIGGPVSYTHLT